MVFYRAGQVQLNKFERKLDLSLLTASITSPLGWAKVRLALRADRLPEVEGGAIAKG